MLDVLLYLVCYGVGGEWVGGLNQGLEVWVVLCMYVLCYVLCEAGVSV